MSVVICVRDGAHVIGAQLEALREQMTEVAWEVVVADNGSTDGTAGMVREAIHGFPVPLRLIDASSRAGSSHARNAGALAAEGGVIAFCDCDDVVGAGWVQAAYTAAQQADMVGGSLRELLSPFRSDSPLIEGRAFTQASFGTAVLSCNFAASREGFLRIGGFDESLPPYGCEDVELSMRANEAGLSIAEAPMMLVYFRRTTRPRDVLRKTYHSAQAEAVVWHRHRDLYGARIRPQRLVWRVMEIPVVLARGSRGAHSVKGLLRDAVTRVGNLVGYWRFVRGDRAGAPLLIGQCD
ncbi:MAG: glycosyltransferase [Nocardioides sp.]|uniref:glycosyltransferase family 2 protein n=1 Tax=Nocardioides sp. TaxID=35761 RepID=UPI0032658717